MKVDIKFCGLTRAEDARMAAELGAGYVGVVFAGGPRLLTPARAGVVLRDVPPAVRRVGVFGHQGAREIAGIARDLALDVVQLHGGARVDTTIADLRDLFAGAVWPVVRVRGHALPPETVALRDAGDALLLDAYVADALGGAGVTFGWNALSVSSRQLRGASPLVLAGGLRPDNVARAIAALAPDVVDVSSGVESAPGIKDHDRMRAFRDAVVHALFPS